jgi:hypothetical protein
MPVWRPSYGMSKGKQMLPHVKVVQYRALKRAANLNALSGERLSTGEPCPLER